MKADWLSGPLNPRARRIEALALTLLALAGEESVRVIEALAGVYANQARQGDCADDRFPSQTARPAERNGQGPTQKTIASPEFGICQRVARRALRGSLVDPTGGAVAFHRIDASPAWSHDRLPIATFGSFLFYAP
jgi:N-acetylmuramoyl-L-alanine amidase